MRKLLILTVVFAGLVSFVYFYEIAGKEERDKAKELEESLFRLEKEDISGLEIRRQGKDTLELRKEGDTWMIDQPIETQADQTTVSSFLNSLTSARRDRVLEDAAGSLGEYGLDQVDLRLNIISAEKQRTLLFGSKDFSGNKVYVKFEDNPEVILTTQSLESALDKELLEWRDKKALDFDQEALTAIQIRRPEDEIELLKKEDDWYLEQPLQERADQNKVRDLLTTLRNAEAAAFVSETPDELGAYGLDRPEIVVRVRQQGEDVWKQLELGSKKEANYFARNLQKSPVFTLAEKVGEALTQDVWEFRDKQVLDIEQDQVDQIAVRREGSEIVFRHEDYKWTVIAPEEFKEREVLSYKFWYPLSDIQFETIEEGKKPLSSVDVEVEVSLKDGTTRTLQFAKEGDSFLAVNADTGRRGTISEKSYNDLQFKLEDIVEEKSEE